MIAFVAWVVGYALPVAVACPVALKQKSLLWRSVIVPHVFVLLSVLLLFAFGARLEFDVSMYSVGLTCVAVLVLYLLLKRLGLAYVLSSALQECCLLLSLIILLPVTGFWIAATLTTLPYAFAHLIDNSGWQWKIALTFLWGMLSLCLYVWLHDPLLNITLHALGGGLLIHLGFLLKETFLR